MNIHLIGVGGTAMGNLAAMLKEIGHTVTGSDQALYPPMSDRLREWGIEARPFSVSNLKEAELVIIGNAISRGNQEAEFVLNERIPYMSMPEALFQFFLKGKDVIVVAGTHGKTTTAFLMDHVLSVADKPPGLFVGGLRADGQNGYRISDSPYFVIEGDEYDSAFFDKGAKFLHYRPRYLILTSVEYDHADIYPSKELYRQSFERLLRVVPSEGLVAACVSDKGVQKVIEKVPSYLPLSPYFGERISGKKPNDFEKLLLQTFQPKNSIKRYKGAHKGKNSKDRISKDGPIEDKPAKNKSSKRQANKIWNLHKKYNKIPKLFFPKGRKVEFLGYGGRIKDFSMIGSHNMANACAVLLVAEALDLEEGDVKNALRSFPGVLRRQQIRLQKSLFVKPTSKLSKKHNSKTALAKSISKEIIFIEDFAHHPTAVAKTIEAVRQAWPNHRIHALYEPRSATSHRNVFQKEYIESLKKADFVYLTEIYNKNKVPKKEQLNVKALVQAIRNATKKKNAFFSKNPNKLLKKLKKNLSPLLVDFPNKKQDKTQGEIILAMSNGGFGGIYPKIEDWIENISI